MVGKEALPTEMERGESPLNSPSSTTTFRPGDIVGEQCREQGLPLLRPFSLGSS